jgi:tetratricopeptide (TPR) repeat protein
VNDAGWRVGVEAGRRVVVMENHDAAYGVWRDAKVAHRTLIHIDAHHDMWQARRPDQVTIANFISVALADELVGDVYWVVPDRGWETRRGRRPILRHLRQLGMHHPGGDGRVRVEPERLWIRLGERRLIVCPLRFLPRCDEAVLLDIDVDFMVIPWVSYWRLDDQESLPWCWPAELVDRLREADVKTDLVTIARSVEGSYTPLKWKYLGDELEQRLADPAGRGPAIRGMELMREAAVAAHDGDLAGAERQYRAAAAALPDAAAPWYHLAHLAIDAGRLDDAQELYRHVLAMDPSYRTPFGSRGFPLFWEGRLAEADREFRRALQLDPRDPYALLGIGLIAVEARHWDEAVMYITEALSMDDRRVEGYRALGAALAHTGRIGEAITAYERSLQLTLAGEPLLERAIVTGPGDGRVEDPGHGRTHAELARLHARRGSTARAIVGYRMGIAGGHDGVALRLRLAWLYLTQREWRCAAVHGWQSLRRSPVACGVACSVTIRRGLGRVRRIAEDRRRTPTFVG